MARRVPSRKHLVQFSGIPVGDICGGWVMVQGVGSFLMYTRGKYLHPLDRKNLHPLLNLQPSCTSVS